MRYFCAKIYKNIIWIYLCILMCFAYLTLLNAIPEHIYLEEGTNLTLQQKVPVDLLVCDRPKETIADIGQSTYKGLTEHKEEEHQLLPVGTHHMICYLFGIFPIKEVEVSVVEPTTVYASGHVIGIYGKTDGVFVLGSSPIEQEDGTYVEPAEHILFPGDYIHAVNGEKVATKEELMQEIADHGANPMILSIRRGEDSIDVSVQAVRARSRTETVKQTSYMLGIWVKDDMAGIGTMTYCNMSNEFGALGHGIGDGETSQLLQLQSGEVYEANVLGVKRGQKGAPGELEGVVNFGNKNRIGIIDVNTDIGIYGKLTQDYINVINAEEQLLSMGYKQDVKVGDAWILNDASGALKKYHIMIDSLDYSPADRNKGIRFHVDDKELLDYTGGIVQGLSGSPIIQDGKLIGGVTHVLINDPAKGYGIFVETMLERENSK